MGHTSKQLHCKLCFQARRTQDQVDGLEEQLHRHRQSAHHLSVQGTRTYGIPFWWQRMTCCGPLGAPAGPCGQPGGAAGGHQRGHGCLVAAGGAGVGGRGHAQGEAWWGGAAYSGMGCEDSKVIVDRAVAGGRNNTARAAGAAASAVQDRGSPNGDSSTAAGIVGLSNVNAYADAYAYASCWMSARAHREACRM